MNNPEIKKKKKTWKKVLLTGVCLLIALLCVVAVWRWNDIKAIYYFGVVGSSEKIAEEIDARKKAREEAISEYIDGTVRDFTEEEERKITSGELSVEEATEIIRNEFTESVNGNSANSEENKKKDPIDSEKKEIDEFIAEKIIQLYSYKAYYLGQLGQIEKSAKKDYLALSPKDRNLVSKQSIVDKYIGVANALLIECDAKVHATLKNLEKKLLEKNMDTAIITKINSSYEEEKALKKAYYMSLLKE